MNPDPLLTVLSSKTISTKSVIKQIRHFVETHSTDDASNAAVNATHYLSDEITEILSTLIFVTLELSKVDDNTIKNWLSDKEAKRWEPYLNILRKRNQY